MDAIVINSIVLTPAGLDAGDLPPATIPRVGFEAPALTGNQIWVLPASDGTANQVIQTDGSGNLSFATATAGATGGSNDQIFYEASRTMTASYSITSGKSALTISPLVIGSGLTLTIPSGERLVLL